MSIAAKPGVRQPKNNRWIFRNGDASVAEVIQRKLSIHPAVARILSGRGYVDDSLLEEYIRPTLSTLHDPFTMRDMDAAVERLIRAHRDHEPIVVYGDYDTDGATSTSLLLRTFTFLGIEATYYIPHRIDEGYGMNCPSIEKLAASGVKLIITVDNGICCVNQVARAAELGVDVIVTDHHQPGGDLPLAAAVVNPNRHDCTYPNKGLTGVGVAFKFAHALLKRLNYAPDKALPFLRSLLDLVAIGTIADFAPLTGENRVLVRHGLEQIFRSNNIGINEMKRVLELERARVTTYNIGFQIAPRLNAAGRTDSAHHCVELLTTQDTRIASDIVSQLEMFNRERRTVETRIFEECVGKVEREFDLDSDLVLVLCGKNWHIGVVGIVASKLMEMFDRPIIVLAEEEGVAKGSARSIRAFNIHQALTQCREHLVTFGGHNYAAGLQVKTDNVPAFRRAINDYARTVLSETDLHPSLTIDTEVDVNELEPSLVQDLHHLEPHGPSNPSPLLSATNLRLAQPARVVGTNHLKLQVANNGKSFGAIGFNLGCWAKDLSRTGDVRIDVAFRPTISTYWNDARIELELKDIKLHVSD